TFTVDTAAPTTSISLSPPSPSGSGGWYTGAVGLSVTGADSGGSGVKETRCVLDPAVAPASFADLPAGPCGLTSVSADGQHTVYAASEDTAGNQQTSVNSVSFQIDQTAPTATCDDPAPRFEFNGPGGAVSAGVTDATSGPASTTVS